MNGSQPLPTTAIANATLTDRSCRAPLLLLFVASAIWLLVGSCFGLVASIKFHSPGFFADTAWLTYGRVRPVYTNAVLYGFALQAGLGIGIWLLAHLGRTVLSGGLLVVFGAGFLNLGLLIGLSGILAGDSTGFENLEIPGYATALIFIGYLLIGLSAAITFHRRVRAALYPTQWFLVAAIFWFAWIYCTAQLLLVSFPVRGITQAIIAWWYSQNLVDVWFGLVGLASVFYFLPALSRRGLKSYYLALLTFWILILFTSWACIPGSAPVPAWMPALSTASRILNLTLLIAVGLNVYSSLGRIVLLRASDMPLSFMLVGIAAFLLAGIMSIAVSFWDPAQVLNFSWFSQGRSQLQVYGFFVMICLGAIYWILPRVADTGFYWPRLVRLHFWLASAGLVLTVVPFAAGGIVQTAKLEDPAIPFVDVARSTLMFLRLSTVGDLLLLMGHVLLLANTIALAVRLARLQFVRTYEVATEDLFKAAEAKG